MLGDVTEVLPDDFMFGVATAAFQVEGGLNGPGEPANNWAWWERAGHVEPSGSAVNFWDRYEEHLDRAAAMGCNMFRLGLEWARVEPETGSVDTAALDRYRAILVACKQRGMTPLVTLHHFTHPHWLGDDFWLSSESPAIYAEWVDLAVERLGDHCRHWITINEINIVAFCSYVLGMYPPGRRLALGEFNAATAHLVAAHVKGYEAIHARQPGAFVTTNNSSTSTYEYDRIFTDILLARASGVSRADVAAWMAERRIAWYEAIDPPGRLESVIRRLSAATAPIARNPARGTARGAEGDVLRPALDAVYASPQPLTLDAIAIDYYDPVAANHVAVPGRPTAGGRTMGPGVDIWDERVDPSGLRTYVKASYDLSKDAARSGSGPLRVWIAENGMCNRLRRGRSFERSDGWDRPRYIRENIASMVESMDAGLPIGAYLHWSLVDNYEWGSYEPRFGIHGVDRERNGRILDTDAMGRDAAGTYKTLMAGLRAGDRSVLSR